LFLFFQRVKIKRFIKKPILSINLYYIDTKKVLFLFFPILLFLMILGLPPICYLSDEMKGSISIAMAALLLMASACSNMDNETPNVFRYNESKGIPTLDPAYAKSQYTIWPVNQLYNGLVQMDNDLNIVPSIAYCWEIGEGGMEYSFNLRRDVFFHDNEVFPDGKGRVVTASDFVFSLNRIRDTETASPGAWVMNWVKPGISGDKDGLQALNDSTLVVRLTRPFPAFLGLLSMPYCSVVPFEATDNYGQDFGRNPVGTGPFMMKYWKSGEKLILSKNKNYFEKDTNGQMLPYLDGVSISFVVDKQSEFLEFLKGNVDFLSGVHPSYKDELLTRSGQLNPYYDKMISLYSQPYLNTEYLGFLIKQEGFDPAIEPLQIKQVRQAINYGFDRRRMIKYLRNGMGTSANQGFVPLGLPGFSENLKGYYYDPDKTMQLLEEAGFPGGAGLPEITLTTTSDYLDLCEFIQAQLSESGINIKLELSTGATFRSMVADSKLDFFRGSWIADYPDAENYFALFYSPNFSPKGPNYTHFRSAEFDKLYDEALVTQDNEIRYQLYRRMDSIIIEEAPVVPLFYDRVVRFFSSDLEGMEGNAMNLLSLKRVKRIQH
jgi:peptide/nickel transport system substrate-binding protein